MRFSNKVVIAVILLNVLFALAVLAVSWHTRGAAGGGVLLAELLAAKGYMD